MKPPLNCTSKHTRVKIVKQAYCMDALKTCILYMNMQILFCIFGLQGEKQSDKKGTKV